MAKFLCIVTFLSACVLASALDCYECNDCSSFFTYSSRSETCPEPFLSFGALTEPRCMKQIESDGTIVRSCSDRTTCTTQELINKCSGDEVGCRICCDGNNCNSASFLTVSMATLILSTAFALVRMF
ncbi:uncharacterized protein LOC752329 [Strongylocentrotus purpuratus]|uniref:Uncharacterized protein n=1 Tax=Strongylocentrotus purpuratus TaxID=7668 RepID=A0A7M7FZW4_STRPU|nr:uncharacterized protein LOC752329 [Strongylocentrotus purpuratus]